MFDLTAEHLREIRANLARNPKPWENTRELIRRPLSKVMAVGLDAPWSLVEPIYALVFKARAAYVEYRPAHPNFRVQWARQLYGIDRTVYDGWFTRDARFVGNVGELLGMSLVVGERGSGLGFVWLPGGPHLLIAPELLP